MILISFVIILIATKHETIQEYSFIKPLAPGGPPSPRCETVEDSGVTF